MACGGFVGTASPTVQARYVDADGSDTLSATFQWRQAPHGSISSVAGPSRPANNIGGVILDLGAQAEGKTYKFRVRTFDGKAHSPWSSWCSFTVDLTAPPAPIVTPVASGNAPVYTGCDPADINSCTSNGGPGIAGAFVFSPPPGPAGADIVRYVYGWGNPTVPVDVPAGAPTSPILLAPPRDGLNTLDVVAVDRTNRASPTTRFLFLVNSPSPTVAYWPLNGSAGFRDMVSGGTLAATNVTWTDDARYYGATAATFDQGQAIQTVPAFDTSGSFSAVAWVRLASSSCSGNATAVAVDGDEEAANNHVSGFALSYDCAHARWRFAIPDQNTTNPTIAEAVSPNGSAKVGLWTLLVGTYDEATNQLQLWVDGVLVSSVTPAAAWTTSRGAGWKATGPVTIGRDRWNGADAHHFSGEIDGVRLWNRALVDRDINGSSADPANGIPAQNGFTAPQTVGYWWFAEGGCFCPSAFDAGPFGRSLTVVPNWTLDPEWSGDPEATPAWLDFGGRDGSGELRLDGQSGYASTADDAGTLDPSDDVAYPVLHTDQSLSMAVWVRLAQPSSTDQVVVSAGPVSLLARGSDGKWGFTVTSPDGSGGTLDAEAISDAVAVPGAWVHLVGVFNASAGTVTLYVNGAKQATVGTGAAGGAYDASLTVGARAGGSGYLGGSIDDVQVFQGFLNDREVTQLYNS